MELIYISDGIEIAHAVITQPMSSKNEYQAEYKDKVKGQGRSDPANAFPEHKRHRKVQMNASAVSYNYRFTL